MIYWLREQPNDDDDDDDDNNDDDDKMLRCTKYCSESFLVLFIMLCGDHSMEDITV